MGNLILDCPLRVAWTSKSRHLLQGPAQGWASGISPGQHWTLGQIPVLFLLWAEGLELPWHPWVPGWWVPLGKAARLSVLIVGFSLLPHWLA